MSDEKQILLLTQKNKDDDDPNAEGLHRIGTLATVLQLLKLPDQTVRVLVEGKERARVTGFVPRTDFFQATVERIPDNPSDVKETEALIRTVKTNFEQYIKLNKKVPAETLASVAQIDDAAKLADTVASHLSVKIADRQALLETLNTTERLERVLALIEGEIGVLQVERKIRSRVKRQMEKTQREYYLNEQLKAIQKELGEGEEGRDELAELEERIKKTKLSKEAREKAQAELKKLRSMSPMSAEATVVRNYLDWMLSLPWGKKSKVKKDILEAERVLNEDHYGLEKVKERILEYLAVQQRAGKMKGPILCLVGPPGVGKTTLGKIIQSMKKAKTANPLFLLDEIDKLGADWRGDPSSALLEVLDPEQNSTFNDHYLEVDFDLSDVMFITTANTLRMPQPLMDRMEIIRIPGYTEDEKVEIAKRHLIPKVLAANGLKEGEWKITDEGLRDLIRYHTREAGVRNLEREIANLARKAVKDIVSHKTTSVEVTQANVDSYAGVRKFRYGEVEGEDQVGVVTGLAWTEVGGDTLQIESVMLPGRGRMQTTGKLGDVMKESIDAARSYVRSKATSFGIKPPMFEQRDIHVHVPEGATPKDGPSAGLAMATSIVSVLTGIPIRRDVAMTGEVTLRGRALPIGGLKEKLLAALRAGITTVIIPKENEKDLAEVPDNVKSGLKIVPVATMGEVLKVALVREPEAIDWSEPEAPVVARVALEEGDPDPLITH